MNKLFLLQPLIIAVIAHPSHRDFFKDRLRVQPLRQVTPAAASVLKLRCSQFDEGENQGNGMEMHGKQHIIFNLFGCICGSNS